MRALALPAVLCSVALAACGGDGDADGEAAQRERFEDAQARFAQCMREQGVDIGDPENGRLLLRSEGPADGEKLRRAQEKCEPILREAPPPEMQQGDRREFEQRALAFARCMREQGIDFPDPVIEGPRVRQEAPGTDPEDPRFKRAEERCRKHAPQVGGPGGAP